ncbi:hypothetical protein M0R19_00690 [Candidatus Pacearchaeota archaeon]|jgi:hypothetical protein|nr:hypothetical protein [Candidatus Pacearchaeota archaeon]
MVSKSNTYKIISGILLIITIILGVLYFTKISNYTESEEKAILNSELFSWNENLYNNTEMFYTFNIYNYGNEEAKNIKVTCKSFELDTEKLIAKATDSFGNLASNSYKQYELITKNVPTDINKEYTSLCYVESCDNCEILYNKIPELVQVYSTN